MSQIQGRRKSLTLDLEDVYTTLASYQDHHSGIAPSPPGDICIKIKRNKDMKKLIGVTLFTLTLSSCGTAQGLMNGAGEVLTGMAVDARSVGNLFN